MEASALTVSPAERVGEFTPDDLAAADHLVQLSVSGGGGEEQDGRDACSSSSMSSPRSVNKVVAAPPAALEDEEEEVGDANSRTVDDRRVRKRYRPVSELYAATRRVKSAADGGNRKSKDGIRMDGALDSERPAGRLKSEKMRCRNGWAAEQQPAAAV